MRIPWCFVEPEEGKFDWSIVDTPMQRFAEGGLKAAFRFTCSENGSEAEYATPKWVKNAGAKFHEHGNPELPGRKETTWEPDFDDPVFLEKLDHFLTALAARYDGHPDVAFVDIGSFGVWGEGHTWGSTGRIYPSETIERHIALHVKHFKQTPVAANVGFLERPGTKPAWIVGPMEMKFPCPIPLSWRGKTHSLHVGLHNGSFNDGFADVAGRLLPHHGDSHRTVHIGDLSIAKDGTPTFNIRPGTFSRNPQETYAAQGVGIEFDAVNRPHSCTLSIRLFLPKQLPLGLLGPAAFIVAREAGSDKEIGPMKGETMDPALISSMVKSKVALRDDSVQGGHLLNSYFNPEAAAKFWPSAPIILETFHYGMMKEWKTWGDGSGVLQAVEDDHASFLSIYYFPEEFLKENRELVKRINLRLGYRFQLQGISWRDKTPVDGKFVVNWKWRNAGVAPCHMPTYPAVTLKDKKGGIVAVFVDENVRLDSLLPGKEGKGVVLSASRTFAPPPHFNQAGQYDVYVSAGDRLGKPLIALPLDQDDGHRRYRMGTCRLVALPGK